VQAVIPFSGLELLSTAVLMLDENLNVTYANPAAETMFAHGRKHLIGTSIDRALPGSAAFALRLRQAIDDETGFNENDLLLDVGGEPMHLHCVVSPLEGADDEPRAALVLELRELDQQIKIERESRILEQQEMNRELIRNLAHEIKNPLGGIRGAAQLLERELGRPGAPRVHPGDREGGRPPAGAAEPPAHAEPPAARGAAQHPRGPRARAHAPRGGVPGHRV
jgi:two-component system nitrogen regulation sensor histidine kinase GlnL